MKFVLVFLGLCTGLTAHSQSGPITDVRVFYSGQSLLNLEIPFMVDRAARAQQLSHLYNVQIGSTLESRLQNPTSGQRRDGRQPLGFDVRDEIRLGSTIGRQNYNTLVISEAVGTVAEGGVFPHFRYSHSVRAARSFYNLFNEGNSEPTRAFLYEVWPLRSTSSLSEWKSLVRSSLVIWECIASAVNARRHGHAPMRLIPGAQALVRLVTAVQQRQVGSIDRWESLFSGDGYLSDLGNYYMSLVVFAALHETSPVGMRPFSPDALVQLRRAPLANLPEPGSVEAARLQEIAFESVNTYRTQAERRHSETRGLDTCRQHITQFCVNRGFDAGECDSTIRAAF